MNTQRVIQNLKIIDVPAGFTFCLCCGLWQQGPLAKRQPGSFGSGICGACARLSDDEQGRGLGAVRKQQTTSEYYSLSRVVHEYKSIVEGGITVAQLIARLQELDPEAYVITRYNDPDEGEVYLVPAPGDQEEIMGVPYYQL